MSERARILIAEDDENAAFALRELLEEAGYEVDTAKNGLAALHKLQTLEPDFLLADYQMPGLDGLRLADAATALLPKLRVLLMSALDLRTRHTFLPKPVQLDDLLSALAH